MPYYKKINTLFIHIPKTGGTSLENYLKNKYEQKLYGFDSKFIFSLQHFTYNLIYKYKKYLNIDINNYIKIITIVRNPYDRIISDLFSHGLIKKEYTSDMVYKEVVNFIYNKNNINYDHHRLPQYLFITDKNENIIPNIKIFKTENLTKELIEYGFSDYEGKDFSTNYIKYLNMASIDLINYFYKKDFTFFNYNMIYTLEDLNSRM